MANDKTQEDLDKFQHFLYRNFKNHPKFSDMRPVSNQPVRLFATAKNHKFDDLSLITLDDLKFRPIIGQSNTYTYNTVKIVSNYLQPLTHNDYFIKDTLTFAEIIKSDVLDPDEEYVSHSLITLDDLKFRPIIDQSNTYTYNAVKIVSNYLQSLTRNDYVIKDTHTFAEIIKSDVLEPDEEYILHDVESLFTSIPVKETID